MAKRTSRASVLGLFALDVVLVALVARLPSRLEQGPAGGSRGPWSAAYVERDQVTFANLPRHGQCPVSLADARRPTECRGYSGRIQEDGRVRESDAPPLVGRAVPLPNRVTLVSGSESMGDYRARVAIGDVVIDAHLGAYNPRPRYQVARGAQRTVFETADEADLANLVVVPRDGALHLLDAHGFHVVLDASDLHPIGPRENRLAWLAGALGAGVLGLVLFALVLAHLLALVVERAAREHDDGLHRWAQFASSSLLVLAGGAVFVVWSAGAGMALP